MSNAHGSTAVLGTNPSGDFRPPDGRPLRISRSEAGPAAPTQSAPPAQQNASDPAAVMDMTLRDFLTRLMGSPAWTDPDPWIDPRDPACPAPYRTVLNAARRGDLALCKVGRRLLVRRSELDRWIAHQPITPSSAPAAPTSSGVAHILQAHGYLRKPVRHA